MKTLILAILLLGSAVLAGNDGGGGGGFCINQKCVTLAEAGFRLTQEEFVSPVISASIFEEVKEVLKLSKIEQVSSSIENQLLYNTFGGVDTFKVVNEYDSKKFEKYKQEYIDIITKNGHKTDNFELFAVSDFKNTYLLPSFEKLSLRSKALILIHEGLIRNKNKLENILRFDSGLVDTLGGKLNLYDIFMGLNSSSDLVLVSIFKEYQIVNNKPYPLHEIFEKDNNVDPYVLSKLYEKDRKMWRFFNERKVIGLGSAEYDQTYQYYKYHKEYYNKLPVVKLCQNQENKTYVFDHRGSHAEYIYCYKDFYGKFKFSFNTLYVVVNDK